MITYLWQHGDDSGYLQQHLSPMNVSCYGDFIVKQQDGSVVENVCFYQGQRSQDATTCQYEYNLEFWRLHTGVYTNFIL